MLIQQRPAANVIPVISWALASCAKFSNYKLMNMKKFIFASLVAALSINSAFADPVINKDPYIKQHPHGEFGINIFKKIDVNNDKVIEKKELIAHHKIKFDLIDADHDGKIRANEAKAAKREKSFDKLIGKKEYLTFEDSFVDEEAHFYDADNNHDGKVTKEEYKLHYLNSFRVHKSK